MKTRFALLLTAFAAALAAEGPELVRNGGFEDGSAHWSLWSWQDPKPGETRGAVTGGAAQGSGALAFEFDAPNDARAMQEIAVEPGKVYLASALVATSGLDPANIGAGLIIDKVDATRVTAPRDTGGEWVRIERAFKTSADQRTIELSLFMGWHYNTQAGMARFDSVSVRELSPGESANRAVARLPSKGSQDEPAPVSVAGVSGENPDKDLFLPVGLAAAAVVAAAAILGFWRPKGSAKRAREALLPVEGGLLGRVDAALRAREGLALAGLCLLYLGLAFFNLGDTMVPETVWEGGKGQGAVIEFEAEVEIGKAAWYERVGSGGFTLQALDVQGRFYPVASVQQGIGSVLRWHHKELGVTTRAIRLVVDKPTVSLAEIAFYAPDGKTLVRVAGLGQGSTPGAERLIDEQERAAPRYDFMSSAYFDEIYHPRTALEYYQGIVPYENTHPPLGKLIQGLGILAFGMNPFGWRVMGTLFGALMLPAMYLIGRRLFKSALYAFLAAFLICFDFMHYAQTRIGTIDSYPLTFLLFSCLFLYEFYQARASSHEAHEARRPLFLAGLFWGLAAASKWTAVYGAFAMLAVYAAALIRDGRDYLRAVREARGRKKAAGGPPEWTEGFVRRRLVGMTAYAGLACVVVPAIVYAASFLPTAALPGRNHGFGEILRYQASMYNYHASSVTSETHPWSSEPWGWPLSYKPLLEYRESFDGLKSVLYVYGNPLIFWAGIACVAYALYKGIKRRDPRAFLILAFYASQYLPWFAVKRLAFIYHYFTATPFMMLAIVLSIMYAREDIRAKPSLVKAVGEDAALRKLDAWALGFAGLVLLAFIALFPTFSGLPMGQWYWSSIGALFP
jgi:hypothetical protein